MSHPYRVLNLEVEVDRQLVRFVKALNAIGYRTEGCCVGNPGKYALPGYISAHKKRRNQKGTGLPESLLEVADRHRVQVVQNNKYAIIYAKRAKLLQILREWLP